MHAFWHWLMQHMGVGPSTDPLVALWYSFWSGIGSDFGEYALVVGLFANLSHQLAVNTCHVGGPFPHGCKLPSMHEVEVNGVRHRVCHKHSGHPILRHHPTLGLHHAHQETGLAEVADEEVPDHGT